MTNPELRFLKELLSSSCEWIETGPFVGISKRTVESFARKGLIETKSGGREDRYTYAKLLTGDAVQV